MCQAMKNKYCGKNRIYSNLAQSAPLLKTIFVLTVATVDLLICWLANRNAFCMYYPKNQMILVNFFSESIFKLHLTSLL